MPTTTTEQRIATSTGVSPVEAAYSAGIIDGEGCIGIHRALNRNGRNYYRLTVRVTNTDTRMLAWLASTWGGAVYGPNQNHGEHSRPIYQWSASGESAIAVIRAVAPFLIVKFEQAQVAEEFQATVVRNGAGVKRDRVTAEDINERDRLYSKMRELNRRGR